MTLDEYAMQRMWESIAKDDVKEAAFWLGLLAEPESQTIRSIDAIGIYVPEWVN